MQLRNWTMAVAAIIAGITGTIVFDLFGLVMGMGWDLPEALSGMLGVPLLVGAMMHYGIGSTLAVVFAALLPLFVGPTWLRGALFATVHTILGVWLFMMPMMGMGPAGAESETGVMMGVMSLVRHWLYGIAVGLVYPLMIRRAMRGASLRAPV